MLSQAVNGKTESIKRLLAGIFRGKDGEKTSCSQNASIQFQ
jgi:hypothetical protein